MKSLSMMTSILASSLNVHSITTNLNEYLPPVPCPTTQRKAELKRERKNRKRRRDQSRSDFGKISNPVEWVQPLFTLPGATS